MKSSFNQRYLISYISKLLYLQWFSVFRGRRRTDCAPISGGNRAKAPLWTSHSNMEKQNFQYLLGFFAGLCAEKHRLREILKGGDSAMKNDMSLRASPQTGVAIPRIEVKCID